MEKHKSVCSTCLISVNLIKLYKIYFKDITFTFTATKVYNLYKPLDNQVQKLKQYYKLMSDTLYAK